MIFTPPAARMVMAGRKTTHRQPAHEIACKFKRGRSYAVQYVKNGIVQPAIGRLELLAVRRERLGDLDYRAARAEGFETSDDFFEAWDEAHSSDRDQQVWVLGFTVADPPLLLAARFGHGDYTHNLHLGARDEPEAVSRTVTSVWAGEASQTRDLRVRRDWEDDLVRLEREVQRLKARAPGRKDVQHEFELMERRAASLRRKLAA